MVEAVNSSENRSGDETGAGRDRAFYEEVPDPRTRLVRLILGSILTLVGCVLLVLPGPGMLVLAAGLAILSRDVPFARRLYDRVHDRIPKTATGGVPMWVIILTLAAFAIALGVSIVAAVWYV